MVNRNIRLEKGKLKLPKMSPVKIIRHREIPENYRLKSVTVSQEPSGKYYVSLLYTYENQISVQEIRLENILGIDFAMSGMAVFSDGNRVSVCHEKVKNQRKDFQHQLSRKLADHYDAICVENLNMKAMSQSLHFGKSVMDNAYGIFLNMLDYKLKEQGKKLVKTDRIYSSSKTCCKCGEVKKN